MHDVLADTSSNKIIDLISKNICRAILPDATPEARQAIDNINFHINEAAKEEYKEKQKLKRFSDQQRQQNNDQRKTFQAELAALQSYAGTPQQRGYELERLLERFLEFEELKPRGSFRVAGEQIDGSFIWNGSTHLVEAKWQDQQCSGAEFGAFHWKVAGKSVETRGLFISINGYSKNAVDALNNKGELRFVCIDGAHLYQAMAENEKITNILETVWRHASETGEAFLLFGSKAFNERHKPNQL